MNTCKAKVAIQQRVLARYRAEFFGALEGRVEVLSLFAGKPRRGESIAHVDAFGRSTAFVGRNVNLFRGHLFLCLQPGLLSWLKDVDPDALILDGNPRMLSNWRAARWMRARGRPIVAWGPWAPTVPTGLRGLALRLWRRYLGRFDAYVAYSSKHVAECVALGLPEERFFVAANSVKSAPPQWPVRPLGQARLRVLFVGRLEERKRVDVLLRACAAIRPHPELWVVGEGPARGGLESLARSIFPDTKFFGALYDQDLAARFLAADIFVLPGTGGLAIQEAMYYGLPVAVGEADGTQAELITPNNGWAIPPGDVAALAGVLIEADSDRVRLREMGTVSTEIIKSEVNLERMVAGFEMALSHVLGR